MKKITQKLVFEKLSTIMDPELNIPITDLGLIYKVLINKKKVKVVMTLTTSGCPLFEMIESEIKNQIKILGYKEKDIKIELIFDPPWSMDKMTARGKKLLGI